MIRKFESQDLDAVMQIWLHGNLDAHPFIQASFWTGHFETVRDMLPQAELYVHENEDTQQIDGFIGLTENHIEGIFRCKSCAFQGHRQGTASEGIDEDTNEAEIQMLWTRQA